MSEYDCTLVSGATAASYVGKQALTYTAGIYKQNSDAQGICMHLVHFPPAARAKAHLHENHETVIYILSGETGMWYGEKLEKHLVCKAGDFLHIPAGMPHLPYNLSETEGCTAVLARTDPNEQESVVLKPALEGLVCW
jgi:uncharacterized RmlC-like cupin family protein